MLKTHNYKKNSLQEYLAYLVWSKQNTVFAKQTLAVVLSNVSSEKCFDIYEEFLEELYPGRIDIRKRKEEYTRQELENWINQEKIVIESDNATKYIQI